MSPLRKPYITLALGIVLVAMIWGAAEVLHKDWWFAHRTYNIQVPPVDWVRYQADLALAKGWRSLFPDRRPGLPQVRLYVPRRAQKALVADVPISTKRWQRAFRLMPDGTLRRVKVRYNGDNPVNWMYGKKSWRVKTRKSELIGRQRNFNYVAPQKILLVPEYAALDAARRLGVLVAPAKLVEMFVNDKSQGVVIETTRLDEVFLRNAGLMPVNLYKGEHQNLEAHERSELDLFNNPALWRKTAMFNQRPKADRSDLARILTLVRRAESSEVDFEQLLEALPPEIWGRFAAYQVLVQSLHNDWIHNMRLVVDPWTGVVHPIAHDTSTGHPLPADEEPFLDAASHGALRLLHTHSQFLAAKYRLLYRYLSRNRVLAAVADHIDALEPALDVSIGRDVHLGQYVTEGADRALTKVGPARQARRAFTQTLRQFEKDMTARLSEAPRAQWTAADGQFIFSLDGEVPLSALELRLADGSSGPRRLVLDADSDGRAGAGDPAVPFVIDGGVLRIDASWFANRIPVAVAGLATAERIVVRPTHFRLIGDRPLSVVTASAANALTGRRTGLPRGQAAGAAPARFNRPIFAPASASPEVWSGDIVIGSDRVVRHPIRILAGTNIRMASGASLVFRSQVAVEGAADHPVTVEPRDPGHPWGVFALLGAGTGGSRVSHMRLTGGSGDEIEGVRFLAMLSIHDTADVEFRNLRLADNHEFDDMMHVIYSRDIRVIGATLEGARADGIDIDISRDIRLVGLKVAAAGNDAIDLMTTTALIVDSTLTGSGDKGVSVGEDSRALIVNSRIDGNAIGIESKDGSVAQLVHVDMRGNKVQISAYKKNWRYGGGGNVDIRKSVLRGGAAGYAIKKGSALRIRDSAVIPLPVAGKRIEIAADVSADGDRTLRSRDYGPGLLSEFSQVEDGPWRARRGAAP